MMPLHPFATIRRIVPVSFAAALAMTAQAQIGFQAPTTVPTGARAGGQILADLDGDGDRDLAVISDGNGTQDLVQLFSNIGGTFSPAGTIFLANGSSPANLAAADFNGDGRIDLAVTLKNVNQVQVLTNVAAFNFTLSAAVGTGGVEPRQVTAADMDGDGDADLVISNRDSSTVSVMRNTGGVLSLVGAFAMGAEARDNAVGDFDGDGDLDVAVASHDSRQVAVLMNIGGGALGAPSFLAVPPATRPDGLAAADVDGDGRIDLVVGAGDDSLVNQNFAVVFRGNVGGGFGASTLHPTGALDTGDVFVADLDGDGDLDIVTANQSSGNLSILTSSYANGGSTFGAPTFLTAGFEPSELAGADLDGNGSVDLTLTLRQQAGVLVYRNLASGIFSNYCTTNPNTTGAAANLSGQGSNVIAANDMVLVCSAMPANQTTLFLTSSVRGFTPNAGASAGNLCLGGSIGRFQQQITMSSAAGTASMPVNLGALPQGSALVSAVAGQTWNFQCWFRDTIGGVPTSNFSNGLSTTAQ